MKGEYILAIATLVSIVIGWFLNELSYHFRTCGEEKKQLKEVLFNLLEIWYLIKFTNTDFIKAPIDMLINKLNNKFPEIQKNKEVSTQLRPVIQQMAQVLMPPVVPQNIDKISERYQSTVDSLSRIDPLMAYRLTGNPEIYNYLSTIDDRLEKIKNVIESLDVSADESRLASIKTLKPIIIEKVIKIFEKDVSAISRKISILTWIKTKRKVRRTDTVILQEADKKIDEMLDNLKKAILSGSLKADADLGEITKQLKI